MKKILNLFVKKASFIIAFTQSQHLIYGIPEPYGYILQLYKINWGRKNEKFESLITLTRCRAEKFSARLIFAIKPRSGKNFS